LKTHARNEAPDTFYIYPSSDKGKYRLRHWLYHLDLNSKEKEFQDTKMFLKGKGVTLITLPGLSKERANGILYKLWGFKDELEKKLRPIFPDAAWEYMYHTADKNGEFTRERRLSNAWGKLDSYSRYVKMATGDAESFKDLGIESEFIEYSERLFENYNGATMEIKNEKT
jgi:exonuclease V gamma subunit